MPRAPASPAPWIAGPHAASGAADSPGTRCAASTALRARSDGRCRRPGSPECPARLPCLVPPAWPDAGFRPRRTIACAPHRSAERRPHSRWSIGTSFLQPDQACHMASLHRFPHPLVVWSEQLHVVAQVPVFEGNSRRLNRRQNRRRHRASCHGLMNVALALHGVVFGEPLQLVRRGRAGTCQRPASRLRWFPPGALLPTGKKRPPAVRPPRTAPASPASRAPRAAIWLTRLKLDSLDECNSATAWRISPVTSPVPESAPDAAWPRSPDTPFAASPMASSAPATSSVFVLESRARPCIASAITLRASPAAPM